MTTWNPRRDRGAVVQRPADRSASGRRALLSAAPLLALWAAAFNVTDVAFFPLIALGGILTGLAGLWVRRGSRDVSWAGTDASDVRPRAWPRWSLRRPDAALAVGTAAVHLVAAHALFEVGTLVLPGLAPTAEQVYGRTGEASLWWALLVGGVVTAPLEELYWRGAVQHLLVGRLHARLPRLAARPGVTVVSGALLYGAFHLSTGQAALVAAALLGGLVWGWLLERTGTLSAPMLAHALWACGMLVWSPV